MQCSTSDAIRPGFAAGSRRRIRKKTLLFQELAATPGSDPRKIALARLLWRGTTVSQVWSAERLPNGNTLACGRSVREYNPKGEVIWEFTSADVPDYLFNSMQIAKRLANGNTLVNTWFNQWNGNVNAENAPAQPLN